MARTGLSYADLQRRDRAVLLLAAAALVALGWWAMIAGHPGPVSMHHAVHATGFGLAFGMWMAMMIAMMLPPVLPWILLFGAANRRREAGRRPEVPTAVFASGYFAVWAGFSLAAAGLQVLLQERSLLHGADVRATLPLGGALWLLAGAWQLSPLKAACLRHCRNPLGFFLTRWKDGPGGAFGMGLRHGAFCLACCWALMLLMFALGTMSLPWMALLTLLLCVEKIAPGGAWVGRGVGVAAIGVGAWLLFIG
jgi:predicted metal-binding membrane protein